MSGAGSCPRPRPGGGRCNSRRCPSCGVLWAGDTRKRLLANVTAYGGPVVLVTATAPGADVLPWGDDGRCEERAVWRWNCTAAARWREMHRLAAQAARRKHGKLSLITWTWEYQRRGALHKHLVLGVATAAELAGAHTYVAELDRLRKGFSFGYVDRGRKAPGQHGRRALEVIQAGTAARYVAKYLAPLKAGKMTLSETVTRPDVPALVVYVGRAMTARTGITMRYLRRVRIAHFLGFDPATGETRESMFLREYVRLQKAGVDPRAAQGP
jgi:hypothetical protein